MAAVLACGQGALLSHRSAAALWGIRPTRHRLIDVTTPRRRRPRKGIALHLVRELNPKDCAVVEGIPITTVARTLLDLAEVVREDGLVRAVEQAEQMRLFDLRTVEELIGRSRGRRGTSSLRSVLSVYHDQPQVTRSELERRFLRLCGDAGLPTPATNFWIEGQEVDALWAVEGLVVELDGRSFHQTRAAFERDRIRDTALQRAGYRVLRVTRRRIESDPAGVIEDVRSLLERRPAPAAG
jgi:Protein of unknown function (DUF559)